MGGRPAQPIQLHLAKGNVRRLTKEEIATRQAQEEKLRTGNKRLTQTPEVKANPIARKMFNKLKKLYKDIEYVEALDDNIINRYCLVYAEHAELSEFRQAIVEKVREADTASKIAMLDKLTTLDRQQEKKRDMLIKLEDRLFLNPTARVKNVPKKVKEQEKDPNEHLFD